ncbi:MAG: choice-of-anchor D domain-containing protein, partial [Oceanospirillaceae bacterium]|nr:choice-of-anchor D domain-containing protein [Oceanospirillaceae bacterium]
MYEFNLSNADAVKAIQFDVSFDSNAFSLSSNHVLTSRADGFSISTSIVDETTLRVILFSVNGSTISVGEGLLFSLDLNSKTLPGSFNTNISNIVISDSSGSSIEVTTTNASITVNGSILKVNTTAIDFGRVPLGGSSNKSISITNNGNQSLTISSTTTTSPFSIITELPVNIAAGTTTNLNVSLDTSSKYNSSITTEYSSNDNDPLRQLQATSIAANVYAVNEIHIGTGSGEIHTEISIPVTINNMEPFNGFQFDVVLPNDFSYVNNSAVLSSRKTDHVVSASVVDSNKLRIISYSSTNANFSGSEGEVLTFKLIPNVSNGTYNLNIQNPIITHTTLGNIESDSYKGSISIKAPNLVTSFSSFNFGRIPITSTYSKSITLTNNGNADLIISSIIYDQSIFRITKQLPISLTSGQNDELNIEVIKSTSGTFNENISIRHNDPDEQNLVAFSGELFSPNYIEIETKSIVLPTETVDFDLYLNNNDVVKAIQFDLSSPSNLGLKSSDFSLNSSLTSFNSSVSDISSNTFRFIVYTLNTGTINAGKTKLFDVVKSSSEEIPNGSYSFTFSNVVISDANSNNISSEALTSGVINIRNNNTPTSSSIEKTVTEQVTSTLTLQGSDVDGDTLTYSIVSEPGNGTASITGSTLTYVSTSDTAT